MSWAWISPIRGFLVGTTWRCTLGIGSVWESAILRIEGYFAIQGLVGPRESVCSWTIARVDTVANANESCRLQPHFNKKHLNLGSQRKTDERIELRITQSLGKVCLNNFSYYVLHHSERETRITWTPLRTNTCDLIGIEYATIPAK